MADELRMEPRFSMNKLAEYVVTTSPRRRRTLIINQIKPPTYIVTTYEDARRVLVRFLSDPSQRPAQLFRMASLLRDRAASTPADDESRKSLLACARAVEAFVPIGEEVRYRNRNALAVPGARRNADIMMSGVRIVVCPDVGFLQRGTERQIGALKFHFPVANRLETDALRYAAAILYSYLREQGDEPAKGACVAVDVMAAQYELAPRAMKDRLKNLEAACQEISERWPVLLATLRDSGVSI